MDNAWLFFNFPSYKLNDFIMILVLGFHICSLILTQILVTSSATLHGARLETSESSYAWLIDVGQPDSVALIKVCFLGIYEVYCLFSRNSIQISFHLNLKHPQVLARMRKR